jgi:hypothetical protein
MARSSPEKLAAALRANLKRRKEVKSPAPSKTGLEQTAAAAPKPLEKPFKKSG